MSTEIKGVLKLITPVQQITDTFSKQEIVITTSEQYPQDILIQFTNERISLLNGFNPGDFIDVKVNIRGRGSQMKDGSTRYFNQLDGWQAYRPQAQQQQHNQPQQNFNQGQGQFNQGQQYQQYQGFNQQNNGNQQFNQGQQYQQYQGFNQQNNGNQQFNQGYAQNKQGYPQNQQQQQNREDDLPF